jgi:type IV fimbrial biogenesis protein FimT
MKHAERAPIRPHGITATELMVTLFVASVLLMLCVPSFSRAISSSRLSTQASDLFGTLQRARSEAITRAAPVTVCRSNNGTSCTTAAQWEGGWIVFVDGNGNAVVDASDTVIRLTSALTGTYTLRATAPLTNAITFGSDGAAQGAGYFILCEKNLTSQARAINVNLVGRISFGVDSNGDGVPEDDSGTPYSTCTP